MTIKLRLMAVLVLLLFATAHSEPCAAFVVYDGSSAPSTIHHPSSNEYRKGEVIVKFRTADAAMSARAIRSSNDTPIVELFKRMGISEVRQLADAFCASPHPNSAAARSALSHPKDWEQDIDCVSLLRFDTTRVASVEEAVALLSELDEIELAEPNTLSFIQPVCSEEWHLDDIFCASPRPYQGKGLGQVVDNKLQSNHKPQISNLKSQTSNEQWWLSAINMPALWEVPIINTKRPVIAIVDTGVDTTHPDLQGNIAEGGYNFVADNEDVTDHHGHGTHCAGLAAARGLQVYGANPNALILPMVAVDSTGSASLFDIMLGITRAVNQGADIVSLSLGTYTYSALYHYVVNRAAEKAIVVAAAGNEGFCMHSTHRDLHGMATPHLPCLPGAYESTIGIMATQEDGSLTRWSNFDCNGPLRGVNQSGYIGWGYQLRVPGNNMLSTLPNGEYGYLSGTSMATPLAAGAISRLMQCRNFDSRQQMLRALIMTTRDHIDVMSAYEATDATFNPGHFTETIDGIRCDFVQTSDSTVQIGDGTGAALHPSMTNGQWSMFNVPDVVRGLAVTALAPHAFQGCSSLTSINLGCNMESIGDQCFVGCDNLQELTFETRFPPSAPNTAFQDQHYKRVTLRNAKGYFDENYSGVKPWNDFVNRRDKELATGNRFWEIIDNKGTRMSFIIYDLENGFGQVGDGDTAIDTLLAGNLVIPENVRDLSLRIIGDNAFKGCKLLKSITLPPMLVSIWNSSFAQCEGLQQIELPQYVRYIGTQAFASCTNLRSVTLTPRLETIESYAFSDCTALESIYLPATTPPVINEHVFTDYDKPTLYVPVGCRETYATAPTWKRFKHIEEMTFSGIEAPSQSHAPHPAVYDLHGRYLGKSLPHRKGIYIMDGRIVWQEIAF